MTILHSIRLHYRTAKARRWVKREYNCRIDFLTNYCDVPQWHHRKWVASQCKSEARLRFGIPPEIEL